MRSPNFALLLGVFMLAACVATPEPSPTSVPTNTSVPLSTSTPLPQRESLLRVAILGEITTTNVWTVFDEAGANYWNYATQADYWPRLYHLAPPSLNLEPVAAIGKPPPIICDSGTCTATVSLQPDLTWTDGSPLTADDLAFTVNTALGFRLGLNWHHAYNPDVLEHAEKLDESMVRFYFKGMPSIADWQYGVLQGPIVNQVYWQPRIADAVSLLPDEALLPTLRELEIEFANMQSKVDDLNLSLNTMAPASTVYQETSDRAQQLQEELNSVYNKLDKNRTEYETKLAEARASLFALANANEPTLGPWQFASRIEGNFENRANLGTPFGDPWFDKIRYITFPNEAAAVNALLNDEVDLILKPSGLSSGSISRLEEEPDVTLSHNSTRSARFLAFNHADPFLTDPALHQALACMLDQQALAAGLSEDAFPLTGFVLGEFWANQDVSLPCAEPTGDMRLAESVRLLRTAGYSWDDEPAPDKAGKGLKTPDGTLLPRFSLLSPTYAVDAQRAMAAVYIAQQAGKLGISVDVQLSDADELLYAVYSSGDYDMALLGWRLSAYPAYVCEWFTSSEENPFAYYGSKLISECEALKGTSDLEQAQVHVSEIQSILMQDLPLIPLYAGGHIDAYRNIRYPFEQVVDGLSGLYGAPGLAIPVP